MRPGELGRTYQPGEVIVREGDVGDCMYVIQAGQVEVVRGEGECAIRLALLQEGDFFGEMAIFEREVRAATVRALGPARVLTIDKRTFLKRIQEDPSLAFNIVQTMSQRLRKLNQDLVGAMCGTLRSPGPGAEA